MKKRKDFSNLEMHDLFKEGDYFKAFILAFSILEDRVTATCKTYFALMDLNEKIVEIPFSLRKKAKLLLLTGLLDKKDYDSLCRIADNRNTFYHAYFLGDFAIDKKDVKEIIRLIRVADKKQNVQKTKLRRVSNK